MIYFSIALLEEAKPIIAHYSLKIDKNINKFRVYKNRDICLIITGVGVFNAAMGISYLFSNIRIKESDIIINLGIAGTNNSSLKIGDIVIPRTIFLNNYNKRFYPDLIYKHDFFESNLISVFEPQNESSSGEDVFDMEAYGYLESATKFFTMDKIFIFKIISDYCKDFDKINPRVLIKNSLNKILDFINDIQTYHKNREFSFTEDEIELIDKIKKMEFVTETMYFQLINLFKYYKNCGNKIEKLIDLENLDIKNKREGKLWFERIKKKIMG